MFVDCMEIYVDDLNVYCTTFKEVHNNLKKVLKRCQEHNLSLNNEKCYMMMEGVVLGHFVSSLGIQVDPSRVEVITTLPKFEKKKIC